MSKSLKKQVYVQVRDQVWEQVVYNKVCDKVWYKVRRRIWTHLFAYPKNWVYDEVIKEHE
jgi:hypothetical protein